MILLVLFLLRLKFQLKAKTEAKIVHSCRVCLRIKKILHSTHSNAHNIAVVSLLHYIIGILIFLPNVLGFQSVYIESMHFALRISERTHIHGA